MDAGPPLFSMGAGVPQFQAKTPRVCEAFGSLVVVMGFARFYFNEISGNFVNEAIRIVDAAAVSVLPSPQFFRLSLACHDTIAFNAFQQAVDFAQRAFIRC